jgi:small-conductance mechanosensitive channel
VDDPWGARVRRSDLNFAIWRALKEHEITIAFPQLDVHFERLPNEEEGAA